MTMAVGILIGWLIGIGTFVAFLLDQRSSVVVVDRYWMETAERWAWWRENELSGRVTEATAPSEPLHKLKDGPNQAMRDFIAAPSEEKP